MRSNPLAGTALDLINISIPQWGTPPFYSARTSMSESIESLQSSWTFLNGCFWPILLKKSASVSMAEKYAFGIVICVLRRRFTAQI